MISGTHRGKKSLKALLYFGDDQLRFEKEIIKCFSDGSENPEEKIEVPKDENQKNDLILYILDTETNHALSFLQQNYYNVDDYSKHQWIYARILDCYLSALKVNIISCTYRDSFIEYFSQIVKKSISLYQDIIPYNLKDVKNKLGTKSKPNATGYRLSPLSLTKLKTFTDQMISNGFIDSKDHDSFKQFLHGEIPKGKIRWKKEPKHLVYFINKITKKGGTPLLSPPGQQWKYLYSIFTLNDSDLPEKFYIRYTSLNKKSKQEIDLLIKFLSY